MTDRKPREEQIEEAANKLNFAYEKDQRLWMLGAKWADANPIVTDLGALLNAVDRERIDLREQLAAANEIIRIYEEGLKEMIPYKPGDGMRAADLLARAKKMREKV